MPNRESLEKIVAELEERNQLHLEIQKKDALRKINQGESRAEREGGISSTIERYLSWMRRYVNQYKFLPDSFADMLSTNFDILR